MQRNWSKLGSAAFRSWIHHHPPSFSALLLHSPQKLRGSFRPFSAISFYFKPLSAASSSPSSSASLALCSPLPLPISRIQARHISTKDKKRKKARERKPMTPATSKVKKIKIKSYSSFKSRFRVMNDGSIRRWKEGKRHNAHLKSKKSKRRLRQPGIVPAAYAKVMKKLNFCA